MEPIEYSEADTERSVVREEPYRLFMESETKPKAATIEWNFTLGDCEADPKEE